MKLLSILLSLLLPLGMQAQYYETVKSTETVIEQFNFVLNGTVNSALGGTSKKYIPFDLPPKYNRMVL